MKSRSIGSILGLILVSLLSACGSQVQEKAKNKTSPNTSAPASANKTDQSTDSLPPSYPPSYPQTLPDDQTPKDPTPPSTSSKISPAVPRTDPPVHIISKAAEISQNISCAVQTCGPAADLPTFTRSPVDKDKIIFKGELEPKILNWMQDETEIQYLKNQVAFKFLKMNLTTLSDNTKVLINYLLVSDLIPKLVDSISVKNGSYVVDISKAQKLLADMDSPTAAWVAKAFKTFFESDIFNETRLWGSNPIEVFIRFNYAGMDMKAALQMEAAKLNVISDRLKANFPIFKESSGMENASLDKALKGEALDLDEKEKFMSLRTSLLLMNQFLAGGSLRAVFLARPTPMSQLIGDILKKARVSKKFQIFADKDYLTERRNNTYSDCRENLVEAIASSPSAQEVAIFEKDISLLKTEAERVAGNPLLLGDRAKEARDRMGQIELVMPLTKDEMVSALSRELNIELSNNIRRKSFLKKLNPANQSDLELVLLLLSIDYGTTMDPLLSSIEQFCNANKPKPIVDSSLSEFGIVFVGWRSVLYPQYGYGIIGHEMGHVFSKAAGDDVLPIKNCLKNQKGSDDYVEEDFADQFAVQVMANVSAEHRSNFACLILRQDENGYKNFDLKSGEGDVHSSNFYRLIALDFMLGDLKPACSGVKASAPPDVKFGNCWPKNGP